MFSQRYLSLILLCITNHISHPFLHNTPIPLKTKNLRDQTSIPFPPSPTFMTSTTALQMSSSSNIDISQLRVMVNGMPGPMATAAAEACLRKNLKLAPIGLTGPDVPPSTISVCDPISGKKQDVKLIPATNRMEAESALVGLRAGVGGRENVVAIDYTHPSAVNENAKWYVENELPFVMGTTGGDREMIIADVTEGKLHAVVAPNMGKQIVAMQAALERLAESFPGAFAGYKLEVTESHQKTKADTSGTAKAVISAISTLVGPKVNFDAEEDVVKVRDDEGSVSFGVPREALDGHAFHTYSLTSPDGSTRFELKHNVVGRTIYAEGTADAVKFLARKLKMDKEGRLYTMIDVLEEGALE